MVNDVHIFFCSAACPEEFKRRPEAYRPLIEDPVTGAAFKIKSQTPRVEHGGALYVFKTAETRTRFAADPEKWIRLLNRCTDPSIGKECH